MTLVLVLAYILMILNASCRRDNRDSKACLRKALFEWIKQNYSTKKYGLPSWKTLLEPVAEVDKHLFKKLAEKFKATST
jgi:hypothetical protein